MAAISVAFLVEADEVETAGLLKNGSSSSPSSKSADLRLTGEAVLAAVVVVEEADEEAAEPVENTENGSS